MKLVIDTRERDIIDILKSKNVDFLTESLDIGDIVFKSDSGDTIFLIERKTINDLKASICDGRSREQKARMLNSGLETNRLMYIIEGVIREDNDTRVAMSTVVSSLINTQLRDNIKTYKTISINETVSYIIKLLDKFEKNISDFFKEKTPITNCEYASTLNSSKKKNMTPEIWFIKQLSLIPQITEDIASHIVEKYNNVAELLKAYELCESEERELMLANITYANKKGKIVKFGPKKSTSVYKMLYNKT